MKSGYIKRKHSTLLLFLLAIYLHTPLSVAYGQSADANCDECFNTEIISFNESDNYLTVELQVNADGCSAALSHFTVEIPCGTVTEATNSGNWPMEINSTDPTTNIYGLKVDDIQGFGEDGQAAAFTLKYTIQYDDDACLEQLKSKLFKVAYKAGTCIAIDEEELVSNKLQASIDASPIICYGSNDGQATVTVTNGTPPYECVWSNGATTETISNLSPGAYTVTISDANNETVTLEAIITQPESLKATAQVINTTCGQADGAISTEVSGGIEPYSFSWNTGATTASIENLSEGSYTLTLTDASGCIKTFNYTIAAETDLRANISSSYLECYEEGKGTLTVEVSGGTPPYSYLWDNGETTATISELNSGTHQVTITDANGCSITQKGYVVIKKLNIISNVNNPVCYGDNSGSISIDITNGTEPYDIVWDNGETTATIDGLAGDWYSVTVTDAMGCTRSKYIKVSEPAQINLSAQVNRVSCDEADSSMSVSLTASGGTPPYQIYHNNELVDEFVVDKAGYYEFTAVDANGCSVTQQILIERPDTGLDATVNIQQPSCSDALGSVSISVEQGTEPFNALWSDGYSGLQRTELKPGEYIITIEDAAGCSVSKAITINKVNQPSVTIVAPQQQPVCNSTDNTLWAVVEGATQYTWSITDASNTWTIQQEQMEELLYSAGEGQVSISLLVENAEGCQAQDMIILSCTEAPTDGGEEDNGNEETTDCENTCFDIQAVEWTKNDNGCYTYKAKVSTDGSCQHDLSHLTIQVDNGYVQTVNNSSNWTTELNLTDPTTGLYGFKVDDITGFGHSTDAFELEFTICNSNEPQLAFIVAYKAAQCIMRDTLQYNAPAQSLSSLSYPNPFVDQTSITFTPAEDAHAILNIYGVGGELIDCIYEGPVNADTKYNFDFRSRSTGSNIYFYQLKCGNQIINGKLIQTGY
ncbi:SprB repeat-containing protein [Carboxylicivirga sediminis]|uniref:SprB repeat-containing protein n=1 Tax=Carboxylicivirga sediminis TaxID=2006564 RepID=A0A941F7B3_9BACT|nr:SprB repeat-containing protein [Carboxylicivirga sediminis]MBR8537819.1 SprB repeat-containing protein [Carboxylicivirga sediminis]